MCNRVSESCWTKSPTAYRLLATDVHHAQPGLRVLQLRGLSVSTTADSESWQPASQCEDPAGSRQTQGVAAVSQLWVCVELLGLGDRSCYDLPALEVHEMCGMGGGVIV